MDLATSLNLISTLAIVVALAFTGLQVRQANRLRQDRASMAVVQALQTDNWSRALGLVSGLPADASASDADQTAPDVQWALYACGAHIESIGFMVFQGIISIDVVDDLIGGVILVYWSRGHGWIEAERTRTGNPKHMEWCQWLATRIAERHAAGRSMPAYLRQAPAPRTRRD